MGRLRLKSRSRTEPVAKGLCKEGVEIRVRKVEKASKVSETERSTGGCAPFPRIANEPRSKLGIWQTFYFRSFPNACFNNFALFGSVSLPDSLAATGFPFALVHDQKLAVVMTEAETEESNGDTNR